GGDAEGTEVVRPQLAAQIQTPPPGQAAEGPRHLAQADGAAEELVRFDRLVLAGMNDRIKLGQRAPFGATHLHEEDHVLVLIAAFDVEVGDVVGMLVQVGPGEPQERAAKLRVAGADHAHRLEKDGAPARPRHTRLPGGPERRQAQGAFDSDAGDLAAKVLVVPNQFAKRRGWGVSTGLVGHPVLVFHGRGRNLEEGKLTVRFGGLICKRRFAVDKCRRSTRPPAELARASPCPLTSATPSVPTSSAAPTAARPW